MASAARCVSPTAKFWPMPITLDVTEDFAATDRAGPGHRAPRHGGRDPRDHVGHRQVDARQVEGGQARLRRGRHRASLGELPAPQGQPGLPRRPDHRHPAAGALRLPLAPQHAERAPHLLPQARLAPDRRLPDPQPAAPRPPGADLPRRPRGAGEPPDPSLRRHDQARRHRPLHPGALLRGGARPVSGLDHHALAPQPRDAHGRPARGGAGTASSAATTAAPT